MSSVALALIVGAMLLLYGVEAVFAQPSGAMYRRIHASAIIIRDSQPGLPRTILRIVYLPTMILMMALIIIVYPFIVLPVLAIDKLRDASVRMYGDDHD